MIDIKCVSLTVCVAYITLQCHTLLVKPLMLSGHLFDELRRILEMCGKTYPDLQVYAGYITHLERSHGGGTAFADGGYADSLPY
jgi:hypothetical protein